MSRTQVVLNFCHLTSSPFRSTGSPRVCHTPSSPLKETKIIHVPEPPLFFFSGAGNRDLLVVPSDSERQLHLNNTDI
ncbi:hypothetical protein E2C01_085419 [Portunus trituberculatus]|uniref:Uncharacterized protein n=1 Tax=Portunus trituberculatus TaxID=210409 RepID=A0A5B7IXS8_PORTR|nr:hypothetical protein [Portunus trituberculatus]